MSTDPDPEPGDAEPFTPVATRPRHDGWSADRQTAFVEALAECGCVEEACQRVGMSATSAYALRRRGDATSFRQAWDHALDYAVRRLSDAVFSRAIKGVARPVFYRGEQIGERIHHDERLAMFLLRYRDPVRYGAWLDGREAVRHPEGAALILARSLLQVGRDAAAAEAGEVPPSRPAIVSVRLLDAAAYEEEQRDLADAYASAARRRAARWESDSGEDVA